LARLEPDRAKRAEWLEAWCTHDHGDLCVDLVGTSDYPAEGIDRSRAIDLLTKGCVGLHPGRACGELVYRRIPIMKIFMGSPEGLDAVSVSYARRACLLGRSSLPLLGLGPNPCYFVARAYSEGLGGLAKEPSLAALLFEQGCEQELELGSPKSGASCANAQTDACDELTRLKP
jgi:hypothetical protein